MTSCLARGGVPCVHKLRNLERKVPKHVLAEIRDDFHRIVYGRMLRTVRRITRWRSVIVMERRLDYPLPAAQIARQCLTHPVC